MTWEVGVKTYQSVSKKWELRVLLVVVIFVAGILIGKEVGRREDLAKTCAWLTRNEQDMYWRCIQLFPDVREREDNNEVF